MINKEVGAAKKKVEDMTKNGMGNQRKHDSQPEQWDWSWNDSPGADTWTIYSKQHVGLLSGGFVNLHI
jgi:hypothetical protein